MEIANRLRKATDQAQLDFELPDYLAVRIYAIADLLSTVDADSRTIERLIEQINEYDTYGQTGYLGMGVNHVILEKTITQVEGQISAR